MKRNQSCQSLMKDKTDRSCICSKESILADAVMKCVSKMHIKSIDKKYKVWIRYMLNDKRSGFVSLSRLVSPTHRHIYIVTVKHQ